ncbi:phosphate ABC transporter phosphate-binding protein [Anaerofilum sp. An201]|nr:phosphate ABC transporter substrate-binding protein [Anaerofilum sp. An201]OUP04423.1 phosphate ABC transporter phosphate-binding protein [Anaerofilum sp. An201]
MKLVKNILGITAAAAVFAGALAGCSSESSTPAGTSSTGNDGSSAAAQLSGSVTTGGSTSVEHVVNAFIEAFMQENPDVDVTYDPTGSGAGITGASEGTLDIGLSSRALKDDETGLDSTTFALDGIAIIVNNENTVEDLSLEQIKGLATGEITNWSEVGGPDAPVVLIGREAGSGTRDGFESIVGVEDVCKYEQEIPSTGGVIAAVASNPNAFGYASLSAVDDSVKAVTVGGVAATEETVQDGSYQIQRPFVFVTKQGAELSDAAKAFMEFAASDAAAELIKNAGAVPLA